MIDYDKINEYMTTMTAKAYGGFRLTDFALSEIFGQSQCIHENTLHDGFEYSKAKMKMDIEENTFLTTKQKENIKSQNEVILDFMEEAAKIYLKQQNRLL